MPQIGATIEQMGTLSQKFSTEAQKVSSLRSEVTSQISSTWWEGPAAQRFKSEWEGSYAPMLNRLQASLEECATEVRNRSAAIEAAGS